jgi:hypothetical protein
MRCSHIARCGRPRDKPHHQLYRETGDTLREAPSAWHTTALCVRAIKCLGSVSGSFDRSDMTQAETYVCIALVMAFILALFLAIAERICTDGSDLRPRTV